LHPVDEITVDSLKLEPGSIFDHYDIEAKPLQSLLENFEVFTYSPQSRPTGGVIPHANE
jgi:hypothetical protein